MQLHQLKPKNKSKKRKRVGRGGKRGTYSGRGMKGQRSRSGRRFQPAIRELIKKYPKLRGYRFKPGKHGLSFVILNLDVLDKKFNAEETISPEVLLEKKIIRRIKGKTPKVKLLGEGDITKALTIKDCAVSKSAKQKIEKAGGKII